MRPILVVLSLLVFFSPVFSQTTDTLLKDSVPVFNDTAYYKQAERDALKQTLENSDRNLQAFVAMQKERQQKQKQQAMLRIGIGIAGLIVLVIGLMRKRKQKG